MQFIEQAGEQPWCLHLSYIKPHWPYIVPDPYHRMYGSNDVIAVRRSERERDNPHPVFGAFMQHRVGRAFSQPGVREHVIPAYMGLIKQIDDQLGKLFAFMNERDLFDNTMVVFTSDHGDYLGDHWLGEKDLFHEASVKIPLIVCDPSPAADATRGSCNDTLVESIDLLPTFVEACAGRAQPHRLEGRSLLPWLRGDRPRRWRSHVISEYDYSMLPGSAALQVAPCDARLFMIADQRWKYIAAPGFRAMLYDRRTDPDEYVDLGDDAAHADVRAELESVLNRWARRLSQRTTLSDEDILARRGGSIGRGVLIGYWDESQAPQALAEFKGYRE
jgi:arylsulfatase A-like enzyme